jgi:methylglutaconyl-CoA hydratase
MAYETIELQSQENGISRVILKRPSVRNAFNAVMIDELGRVFQKLSIDPSVRVVVLSGEGINFCAGGDLNWMRSSIELSYEDNLKDTLTLTKMFDSINRCSKPVIALVQGAALGGGVGLVSVADIVLATRSCIFSLSEVRLGVVPACIGPFVVSKIGASQARSLFVSAKRFDAVRAQQIGLVHEVVETEAELLSEGMALAETMLACGPLAISTAKEMVHRLTWPEERSEIPNTIEYVAKVLAELRVKPEAQEGVTAFLEKRRPKWSP